VGAVAYHLLTGTLVFEGKTVVEIASHHVHTKPEPPSKRLGCPLPEALEALVLQCLAKKPGDRPDSARALRRALLDLPEHAGWTEADAEAWWQESRGNLAQPVDAGSSTGFSSTVTIDVRERDALKLTAES